jgi:hypothetical protein
LDSAVWTYFTCLVFGKSWHALLVGRKKDDLRDSMSTVADSEIFRAGNLNQIYYNERLILSKEAATADSRCPKQQSLPSVK